MFRRNSDVLEDKLIAACLQQDLSLVIDCKKNGADISKVCSSGRTPLGIAAEIGNVEIVKILLGVEGPSSDLSPVPCTSGTSNMGYFVMVHSESAESVPQSNEICINSSFDLNEFNDRLIHRIPGFSEPLFDSVEIMPDLEWDPEIEDDDSHYLVTEDDPGAKNYLWYASILSQLGSLGLTEKACNVIDSDDDIGLTALHYAASAGHISTVNILLEAGCKINCEDSDNFTPLHLAAAKDYSDMLNFLLTKGANPNHRSTDGISALHVAASNGLVDNAQVLISFGAHVNAVDMADRTPLYVAVSRRHHSVVKLLIDADAKVNFEEIHGYTPLYEAVYAKDVRLVDLLLNAGAKLTQSHHLLHYAVYHRHEEMVRLLLKAGAIVNLRNEEGDTPLMLAIRSSNLSIASLLLQKGALVHLVNHVSRQTALVGAILCISNDCKTFTETLQLLEDFGWDLRDESEALDFAIMVDNDHAACALIRRWHITEYIFPGKIVDIIFRLLRKERRCLVELLSYAGLNLRDRRLKFPLFEHLEWWSNLAKNPLSLQQIARIAVRSTMKPNIHKNLRTIRLPQILKSYLLLEDVLCPCEIGAHK